MKAHCSSRRLGLALISAEFRRRATLGMDHLDLTLRCVIALDANVLFLLQRCSADVQLLER